MQGKSGLYLAIFLIFIANTEFFSQEHNIWDTVKETSWHYLDNWTGGIVTFFETNDGDKMAIWQMCGSGLLVTGSFLFRISIENNKLLFFFHEFGIKEQNPAYIYVFDKKSNILRPEQGFDVLFFFSSDPWVGNRGERIPIDELKREDYSRLDLLD
jgi:hypothetical protein